MIVSNVLLINHIAHVNLLMCIDGSLSLQYCIYLMRQNLNRTSNREIDFFGHEQFENCAINTSLSP